METSINSSTTARTTVLDFGGKQPAIPVGQHPFRIADAYVECNCTTKFGIRDRAVIVFEMTLADSIGNSVFIPLRQSYLASNYPESGFVRLVFQLTGTSVGRRFDVASLINITGQAQVEHKTNDVGDTYANVTQIVSVGDPSELTNGSL